VLDNLIGSPECAYPHQAEIIPWNLVNSWIPGRDIVNLELPEK
jgi:hypothetical protein